MAELSKSEAGWRLGYGGDTLNTAIHLARLGHRVGFITALGVDSFSAMLRRNWVEEGLDADLILTDDSRLPGLYAIDVDTAGERSFLYWRSQSAARRLFALPAISQVLAQAEQARLFCYSLITLAILPPEARNSLLDQCRRIRRRGGRVAFDGNYRPQLWERLEDARNALTEALCCCDIGLPTLADEQLLFGQGDAQSVRDRWISCGVDEVVVKAGAAGCMVDDATWVAPTASVTVLDTSGAGDAFNAGYLHGRIAGRSGPQAASFGHQLAGWVISRSGAIPPVDGAAPYHLLAAANGACQ